MNNPYILQRYHVLLDYQTQVVLTVDTSVSAMIFLNECTPDTYCSFSVNFPNYSESFFKTFFLASLSPKDYPLWTWNGKKRLFEKTNPELVDRKLRSRSKLAESKREVIGHIINHLGHARHSLRSGIEFQETVYLVKRMQAQAFKASGYDENRIEDCHYVVQYADFAGISLRQAADDILLKAKFDDEILAKTELLRLRYFNKVKQAQDPEELPAIFEEFTRNCYINSRV